MKKYISILLIVSIMTLGITACSKQKTVKTSVSPKGTLSEIINRIYEKKDPILKLQTVVPDFSDSDNLMYYTGLSDATKIKEAAVSEAMITSQAYSLVLVRVKDAKNTKAIAKEMLNGINQSKWICVTADDLKVAASGDTILLVMMASSFSDTITSQQIVDAFKTVCGGKIDLILEK